MADENSAKEQKPKKKVKTIHNFGKRKDSVARATMTPGGGGVKINSMPLSIWGTEFSRMRIQEPIMIASELSKDFDFSVSVKGGGYSGQTEAVRQSIARCLAQAGTKEIKQRFMDYDRNLLVIDPRRNETHHAGSASRRGSRRHEQRSKR
ncbi:MAG: 30S ribosomal protein S9 [Candidatus Aenigmarchaeota archaeon]|nr:30S ribosomal protein S9 [Candidatus Aenigmarchaeota archaeon]